MAAEVDAGSMIKEMAQQLAMTEMAKMEVDLHDLLGPRPWPRRVRRLKLEMVYQQAPDTGITHYRGIRNKGRLVVDHYPDWPTK